MAMLPRHVVRGHRNPLYMGLAARLKKVRRASGFDRQTLTQRAAMADGSAVLGIEQGGRVPRLDTVEKIAAALGVSAAFLAFGIEGEASDPKEGMHCEGMAQRLRQVRAARGLSMRALARAASLTDTAVRSTETGATIPTVATVEALARALNVSPGWLGYGTGPQTLPAKRGAGTAQTAADS